MIEKLVTSLDVSRKLKDLGVIQESYFYWVKCSDTRNFIIIPSYAVYLRSDSFKETISAFTVTELGAMMDNGMIFEGISNVCAPPDTFANVIIKGSQYLVFDWLNQNLKEWRDK